MRFLICIPFLLSITLSWAQRTEQKEKITDKITISITGGYQFNSDLSIVSHLKPWDNFEYSTSDFFGGASINYLGSSHQWSLGFQSAYQNNSTNNQRTTLYTRILDVKGLWHLPFCQSLKLGGSFQKKIQELKAYTNKTPEPFLGVFAYSAYYFSPTLAYSLPVKENIWVQISFQHAIPLNEAYWTQFNKDDVTGTKESQNTSRVFLEVFYKL